MILVKYSWAIDIDIIVGGLAVSGVRESSKEWINPAINPLVERIVLSGMFSWVDSPLDESHAP